MLHQGWNTFAFWAEEWCIPFTNRIKLHFNARRMMTVAATVTTPNEQQHGSSDVHTAFKTTGVSVWFLAADSYAHGESLQSTHDSKVQLER